MYGIEDLKQHQLSLDKYKEMVKDMLEEDCLIRLTTEDKRHLKKLTTETQVDQFRISKIMNAY